jgi:dihydroorotase
MYDLVIAGGMLVDPGCGLHEKKDVAVEKERIVLVDSHIPRDGAWEVLDASDHLVTPGLIDIHVHVYPGVSHYGIDPDPTCLARGATTVNDAGSSGADTFEGLRRYVIEVVETRVTAFLNISSLGMISPLDNELEDLKHASPERAIGVCERNRDVIQGIKVRLTRSIVGDNGLEPLRLAARAAEALGMPLMVHVGDTPSPLGEILAVMRPGDLLTHCFHGRRHGILDDKGDVLPEVREAVRRGVVFDVGHGVGSFSFEVARRALAAGLTPGTISSDLHYYNLNGPVFDLATTMSKFLPLGLALDEILAKTTSVPARVLGLSDRLGALRPGFLADIAIFRLNEGDFEFEDSTQQRVHGTQKLEPVAVIRRGRVYRSQLRLERRYGHRF